jgi:hypothetical protein
MTNVKRSRGFGESGKFVDLKIKVFSRSSPVTDFGLMMLLMIFAIWAIYNLFKNNKCIEEL